ncbi:hypothetical protein J2S19_002314 [Metabacillus malikii]|uniref:Uncharacterized protein n=1 Tax=Metabacillus malikii TaxID=1504265 RepID=A0ABT9ZFL2_9BACI|nr:hypothetical protein [Metabacillus malikii]
MGFIGGMKDISLPTFKQNGLHQWDEEHFSSYAQTKWASSAG